nr:MAG TPA: hypothetical protein [Bacteriophage sp.]
MKKEVRKSQLNKNKIEKIILCFWTIHSIHDFLIFIKA